MVYIQMLAPIFKDKVPRNKTQLSIILIGLTSLGLGIWTMLNTPTLILPPAFLVVLWTPFTLGVSFVLGFLTKKILRVKWPTLTISSIFVTLFCLTYFISEYRQTLTIIVPDNFAGEAYLILTNESKDDFELNEFGVGYITEQTYKNGFKPKVVQGSKEITEQIPSYSTGSGSFKGQLMIKFLTFHIPAKNSGRKDLSYRDLIENNAIDTTRVKWD